MTSHRLQGHFWWEAEQGRMHAGLYFLPCVRRENPVFPAMKRHPELRTIRLRDINSSFHIRNNIWGGSAGGSGIDCQLPTVVPTK